jgi:hypothetical protein
MAALAGLDRVFVRHIRPRVLEGQQRIHRLHIPALDEVAADGGA